MSNPALTPQDGPDDVPDDTHDDEPEDRPAQRLEQRALWVDQQIRAAIDRGEFDDLPGAGKPIPGIEEPHDPDWWVKRLIERERVTGVLPPALGLRTEDLRFHETLDALRAEQAVRDAVDDFNHRVVEARRQLQGGPPVITPTRDVDEEILAWRARRLARAEALRARNAAALEATRSERRRRWWQRWR